MVKKYKVTCASCKSSNVVTIETDTRKIHWDLADRIISGRYRLDNQWGWQCICGNSNLLTQQEDEFISNKQQPDPVEITQVIKNLIPDKRQLFRMEVL